METQFNDYGLYGHKKLEIFINSFIPQHIRMNYPNFVTFIEIYLKKIVQEHEGTEFIHNMLAYMNIDETSAFFVEEFCKNYLKDLMYLPEVNKRTLVKWIRQWYEATGSQQSFQFLFRVLYNEEVSFYFPSVDIFRISDGKWAKEYIIRVKVNIEDIDKFTKDMIGTEIVGKDSECRALFEDFLLKDIEDEDYVNLESYVQKFVIQPTTEEFIELNKEKNNKIKKYRIFDIYVTDFDTKKSIANLKPHEKVIFTYLNNPEEKVEAEICHIISSIFIDEENSNKGTFFQPGDEIKINHPFGNGAKCVVERVSSGYFYGLQIVNGGHGYEVNDRIGLKDGHGLGFYAYVSKVDENGVIEAVKIGNQGENYLYFPEIVIESKRGEGAKLVPLTENVGSIESIKIIDPGVGYRDIEESDISACFYNKFSVNGCENIARWDVGYDGVIKPETSTRDGYGQRAISYTSGIDSEMKDKILANMSKSYATYTHTVSFPNGKETWTAIPAYISTSEASTIMNEDGYESEYNCSVPPLSDFTNPGATFTNNIEIGNSTTVVMPDDGVWSIKSSFTNNKEFTDANNLIKDATYGPQTVTLGLRGGIDKDYASLSPQDKTSMNTILNIRKPYSFPIRFDKTAIKHSVISNTIVQYYIDNNIREERDNRNDLKLGELIFAEIEFVKYVDTMIDIYGSDWAAQLSSSVDENTRFINKIAEEYNNKSNTDGTEAADAFLVDVYLNMSSYINLWGFNADEIKMSKDHLNQTILRYPYGIIKRIDNEKGIMVVDKVSEYQFVKGMEIKGTTSGSCGNIVISSSTVKFDYESGALFNIPSYYKNHDGHISSNKKIQDSYFYQCYSYVLKSNVDKKEWIEPVNKAVHPSGLIVFGVDEVISKSEMIYGGERIDILPRTDEILWNLDELTNVN